METNFDQNEKEKWGKGFSDKTLKRALAVFLVVLVIAIWKGAFKY